MDFMSMPVTELLKVNPKNLDGSDWRAYEKARRARASEIKNHQAQQRAAALAQANAKLQAAEEAGPLGKLKQAATAVAGAAGAGAAAWAITEQEKRADRTFGNCRTSLATKALMAEFKDLDEVPDGSGWTKHPLGSTQDGNVTIVTVMIPNPDPEGAPTVDALEIVITETKDDFSDLEHLKDTDRPTPVPVITVSVKDQTPLGLVKTAQTAARNLGRSGKKLVQGAGNLINAIRGRGTTDVESVTETVTDALAVAGKVAEEGNRLNLAGRARTAIDNACKGAHKAYTEKRRDLKELNQQRRNEQWEAEKKATAHKTCEYCNYTYTAEEEYLTKCPSCGADRPSV